MQCKNCGASVPEGSVFCNRCGTKLSAPSQPGEQMSPSPPAPSGAQPESGVWSGRYSVSAMGGWILLLCLLGIIFLVVSLCLACPTIFILITGAFTTVTRTTQ